MNCETQNTTELLASARDGNVDAVNDLFQRHRDVLRRQVRMRLDKRIQRRVGESDIIQDVFVEANRRLDGYLRDPKMPFHLWLRHMARDRIIDAHRRHRVSAKRSVDREKPLASPAKLDRSSVDMGTELVDPARTPASLATMRELAQRTAAAIESLEERDREVLMLRHSEHLSNQEVAQTLGLTEPAASMRYLRAIRRLRDMLERAEAEEN
jgi:RNA polymerase sigma-70 factor (ECF subfamily)